jgi:hypothetical protein
MAQAVERSARSQRNATPASNVPPSYFAGASALAARGAVQSTGPLTKLFCSLPSTVGQAWSK